MHGAMTEAQQARVRGQRSLSPLASRVPARMVSATMPRSSAPAGRVGSFSPLAPRATTIVAPNLGATSDGGGQDAWSYLPDSRLHEIAGQMLRGLVAPELLRALNRRDLVALLAAHQKVAPGGPGPVLQQGATTRSRSPSFVVTAPDLDVPLVAASRPRLPSGPGLWTKAGYVQELSHAARVASRSPSPNMFAFSAKQPSAQGRNRERAPSVEPTVAGAAKVCVGLSVVRDMNVTSNPLDATTTALMMAGGGDGYVSVRAPAARQPVTMISRSDVPNAAPAFASPAQTQMRMPVRQQQRVISARSAASRPGGPVGMRSAAATMTMGRAVSPRETGRILVHPASASSSYAASSVAGDGQVATRLGNERSLSPLPSRQLSGAMPAGATASVAISASAVQSEALVTTAVTTAKRFPLTMQGRRQHESGMLQRTSETGPSQVGGGQLKSALSRRGVRIPGGSAVTPVPVGMGPSPVCSESEASVTSPTVTFVRVPREQFGPGAIDDQTRTMFPQTSTSSSSSPTQPTGPVDINSPELPSSPEDVPVVDYSRIAPGVVVSSDAPVQESLAVQVERLDTVLASKLAAADRELAMAQNAAARLTSVTQASPHRVEPGVVTPGVVRASLTSSDDYDAKLAIKMREMEVLQRRTEENISRLTSSKYSTSTQVGPVETGPNAPSTPLRKDIGAAGMPAEGQPGLGSSPLHGLLADDNDDYVLRKFGADEGGAPMYGRVFYRENMEETEPPILAATPSPQRAVWEFAAASPPLVQEEISDFSSTQLLDD